jgi:hypothetical protein
MVLASSLTVAIALVQRQSVSAADSRATVLRSPTFLTYRSLALGVRSYTVDTIGQSSIQR